MQIIRVQAELIFDGKTRAVTPGFRPTLLLADKKALCNVESVEPAPLPPHEHGTAIMAVAWDWPRPCPVRIGMPFAALEGETVVGRGSVIGIL